MRSDAESIVIVVWVVLAIAVPVAVAYDGWANGFGWGHAAVLAGAEVLLALVARGALRIVQQ